MMLFILLIEALESFAGLMMFIFFIIVFMIAVIVLKNALFRTEDDDIYRIDKDKNILR